MDVLYADGREVLAYLPSYAVLVCLECRYAIQPNAIDKHLLSHKIYRGSRRKLMTQVQRLRLAPAESVAVQGKPLAITCLSSTDGLRCTVGQCTYLCVSSKRMRGHQTKEHLELDLLDLEEFAVSKVTLQTFFRGNQLRYFEVTVPRQNDNDARADALLSNQNEPSILCGNNTSASATTTSKLSQSFELVDLYWLHHFDSVVCDTLPFWNMGTTRRALSNYRLTNAVLALSVAHSILSAYASDDQQQNLVNFDRFSSRSNENSPQAESTEPRPPYNVEMSFTTSVVKSVLGCVEILIDDFRSDKSLMTGWSPNGGNENEDIDNNRMQLGSFVRQLKRCITDTSWLESRRKVADNSQHHVVSLLRELPHKLAITLGRPKTTEEVVDVLNSIDGLVSACTSNFIGSSQEDAWCSMLMWVQLLPSGFLTLLEEENAAAMVVVAYWLKYSVQRAEDAGCWYLKGYSTKLLVYISSMLSKDGSHDWTWATFL